MPEAVPKISSTKVYYYLEDSTPYLSVIPVADDVITLGDFKKVFNKKGFKYFCKQLDKTIGCEVKVEINDDKTKLVKSANGLIELVLLLSADGAQSSGTLPKSCSKRSKGLPLLEQRKPQECSNLRKRRSLHDLVSEGFVEREFASIHRNVSKDQSIIASSLSTVISKRAGEGLADVYTSNSEGPYQLYDADSKYMKESIGLVNTSLTTASGLSFKARRQRRPRKERYRKAYVPSTISSVTESSMMSFSLPHIDVVTLPMKNGAFLGLSVLSHDGGIFVSDIQRGGVLDLDGRIEVGDQIVQVNRSSFESLRDVQAVEVLRKAAASKKPITLYIAKRTWNGDKNSDVLSGIASETMPIDVSLWVESTKQNCIQTQNVLGLDENISVIDGGGIFVGRNDIDNSEDVISDSRHKSSNPCKLSASRTAPISVAAHGALNAEEVARSRENEENEQLQDTLNVGVDPTIILKQMAKSDSGLQIKNRKWLKIPVPMSFIGRDLVDWLLEHVHGFADRKAARTYASTLLSAGYIRHVVNKLTFTEKCYYVFQDSILSLRNKNKSDSTLGKAGAETEVTYVGSPATLHQSRPNFRNNSKDICDPMWSFVSGGVVEAQRRSICESSTTNEYASVMGPEAADSNMMSAAVAEVSILKLPDRPFPERLIAHQRMNYSQVPQPPNTPNSVLNE